MFGTLIGLTSRLAKLKIKTKALLGPGFEAQFNPTSYKHAYRNCYENKQAMNSSGAALRYTATMPETLSLTLILQKEIPEIGFLGFGAKPSITDRVKKFLDVAYEVVGKDHKPRELIVSWGKMTFTGYLTSADINYTAFDNEGKPIRAEISVNFKGTLDDPLGAKSKSSPDLTHAVTVKSWQTLPMLTEEIYGDPHLYLLVADANGLDHFRAVSPGQKLHFPPTEKAGDSEEEEL